MVVRGFGSPGLRRVSGGDSFGGSGEFFLLFCRLARVAAADPAEGSVVAVATTFGEFDHAVTGTATTLVPYERGFFAGHSVLHGSKERRNITRSKFNTSSLFCQVSLKYKKRTVTPFFFILVEEE